MRSPAPSAKTFQSVQILRAIAALMVVALHASLQAIPFGARPFFVGNAGVDIFFPISGFVMVVSTHDRQASPATAWRFALARIVRIVPIYWLLTLAKVGAAAIRPALFSGYTQTLAVVAAALFFTPLHDAAGALVNPPIKPGWTLNLEMFYYALIVMVLPFSRRIALYVPVLIIAVVAAAKLIFPHVPPFAQQLGWGSPLALEFAAGMILGQITLGRAWAGRWPWLGAALALAVYLLVPQAVYDLEWGRVVSWGVAGVGLLWCAVGVEALSHRKWMRWPMLLGDASYSIYLTHAISQPMIGALAGRAIFEAVGLPGLILVLMVVPTLAAVAFHLLVEKPLSRGLKSLLPRTAVQRPAPAPA